ncbi:MAG: MBL fold metallo-hydrolase [Candidatus Nanoarchaeia archaeon]|nr:MBL fold metallo-hydrolase [Candidatus Nanoarchaeia archaeon]
MNIKILGGENEIGGNKILIEHKETRIFLDFGMSFKQASKYFSEFLQPRKCASLTDFYEFKLLPRIRGVYRLDYLKHMERRNESRGIDAIFLTHAHADHAQYIHFLRDDIPIYCTKATKIILQTLEETGSNSLSDFITSCDAFTFRENTKGGLSRVTRKDKEYVKERQYNIMEPDKKVRIGSLDIEMVPVDHSLPGACGFIIYSDEGNVVYTGDIRFHGSNQELSKKFIEKAKKSKPKWLLCEGTRINQTEMDSENGVKAKISQIISESKGLVFVEHPIRDTDRVNSIFQATKENKRTFVVNMKLAYLISKLGDLAPFNLEKVKILIPKKSWGLIDKEGIEKCHIEQDYETWEREYIGRDNSITYKELKQNPKKYVVSMSMWELTQLVDIKPEDAIWIKSSCEPFCEEMELDEERKKNWLKHFKIKEYFAHASGHATGPEIREMIKEIKPEILIPIHTEHKELFKDN